MTNNERNEKRSPSQASGPRRLPVVRVSAKLYFVDERLRELRNVQNPHDRLPLEKARGLPTVKVRQLPPPDIDGGTPYFFVVGRAE